MGVASVKVYQLPYESLEDPEAFLQIATNALNFLRNNADPLTNITVHVWISFASLIRGQNRILVPDDDYARNLAEIIVTSVNSHPLQFRQHLEGRPIPWIPIIDCFHC